ncbi:Protein N-acetyltransferase, RimJ/RimL family [Lachnospiraceae bacterium XBB1006]|nr:Protein N-acetyltransferase, RimJ/RimL family [Lachnospiraceae bacterium XBB1006]
MKPKIELVPYYPNYEETLVWYQDVALVKQVDNEEEPYTEEKLKRMYEYLDQHGALFYIAYNGEVVGDISVGDNHEVGIVIRREYQNLHIGRRAMELLIEWARKAGHDRMDAQIYSFNEQSRKMFMGVGFWQVAREFYTFPLVDYTEMMIETKDLWLKKGKMEDAEGIYKNLWRHAESARFMLWEPSHSVEEAKERMLRTIAFQKRSKYAFFIYEKKSGEPIGFANMEQIGRGTYQERGVALGPKFVGKGYGKQVLSALVNAAFADGGKEFWAMHRQENIPSRKVQEACGFVFDHTSEELTDPRTGERYQLDYRVKRS